MAGTVHVIGAGLAGLAAAVRLASRGAAVVLHEAAPQAGGRCRSYFDRQLNAVIDNGNHLVLSGNTAMREFTRVIGSEHTLTGPGRAEFAFVDLESDERWTVRLSEGRLPWWIFDRRARVPGTKWSDYLSLAPLLRAGPEATMTDAMRCPPTLYKRLIHPLFLAVLNADPAEGSAQMAGAVIRETLAAGGKACHPLIASDGLDVSFVTPALAFLDAKGAQVLMQHRVRALGYAADGSRVESIDFGDGPQALGEDDAVVLAVPPNVAASLVPGLTTPDEYRAIVNAHFQVPPPPGCPPMIGVVNGVSDWIFAFENRLSVTISGADHLLDESRESLAQRIWEEVARACRVPATPMPVWQLVREKRATFAATPAQDTRRPGTKTRWRNLMLAGDWTATGLPATIEGALRSGNRAADELRPA
ncbi:FAD-dependent oxidoreductase [Pandoraea nosoerga]|uniref:FAD-binding protein n=1 Tax=Pandoraea nosoerga TaxID=2508296 RepID=A0A5E4W1V4_9BURK|nr:hydroxysqualene dehydroxylase HpnE [Pandoraea nosoerga]MBN4666232.1 FAD-dependent oxidoreductase [Pandoraea nosoerga]MBN4676287.1 FAD-dependent oxidoreductase [Pandoraea nosoerga]MBN4681324.1 FAD-dependent oxidoreductase [Pandoraea nosoerga]MBN4745399.1 FAD-dependent oxidoreductase [Pandoraea nosoerga]VVE17210.1 FAD-binding protein [Pandoraea nosoerga]